MGTLLLRVAAGRQASSQDLKFRNGHDELPSPGADDALLAHDLLFQIPRQDENEVGPGLGYALRRQDRDPCAGREAALLVWIAIHRVVEEIGADAAVVEQRVALAGSAIADHGL